MLALAPWFKPSGAPIPATVVFRLSLVRILSAERFLGAEGDVLMPGERHGSPNRRRSAVPKRRLSAPEGQSNLGAPDFRMTAIGSAGHGSRRKPPRFSAVKLSPAEMLSIP